MEKMIEQLFLMQRESFKEYCLSDENHILKNQEMKQKYKDLQDVLTDDGQVELLEKCVVADTELNEIANFYYFENGFKLAKKILIEMLEN